MRVWNESTVCNYTSKPHSISEDKMVWLWLWLYGFALMRTVSITECKSSRVCYADSSSCNHHKLSCSRGRIAVYTTKYGYVNTTERQCQCGLSDCDSCSNQTKQAGVGQCLRNYNDTDYWTIVSKCSFKKTCSVSLPSKRNNTCPSVSISTLSPSFSKIDYGCLDNKTVVKFCSANSTRNSLTILYEKRTAVNVHCLCNVTVSGNETDTRKYKIRSLDIRNSSVVDGGFFNLSFWNGTEKSIVNKTISQNGYIFQVPGNQKTQIRLSVRNRSNSPRRIWIQIRAKYSRNVTVSCQPEEDKETTTASVTTQTTLTSDGFTTSHVRSTSPDSSSASDLPPEQTDDSTLNQAGIKVAPITGGIAGGFVVVAVITVILVVCHRQRNKSKDGSKKNHTNPLFVDESGYSLADDMRRNTDDVNSSDITSGNNGVSEAHYCQVDTQDMGTIKMNRVLSTDDCYDHVSTVVAKAPPFQTTSDIYDRATEDIDSGCYDRLGTERKQPERLNAEYDTTVSASKAVKDLENQENYYSYDHLGTSKRKTAADSDYDTTSRFTK